MKKRRLCSILLFLLIAAFFNFNAFAGERSMPVDLFVLVDKSLSMEESGCFPGVLEWAEEQLTGQMLVDGDWITLFQFYGSCENLLAITINGDDDRELVKDTFSKITPDGKFTDVGLALDTVREALESRGRNDRYKIMFMLTDLKHEAPWTSRYPGMVDPFASPYLAEARAVDHGGWYEITLDMDIHDTVVAVTRDIYREIIDQGSAERQSAQQIGYTEGGTGIARAIDIDSEEFALQEEPEISSSSYSSFAESGVFIPVLCGLALLAIVLMVVVLARTRKKPSKKKKPADTDVPDAENSDN